MRRRTFDALMATGGLVTAVILAIAGGLLLWGHNFINSNIEDQLSAQKIYFPSASDIKAANNAEITKYVTPYAGQQVTTGQQAEVYANHYIAVHLQEIGQGQTYSQISGKFLGMDPKDPNYADVAAQRQALFMGETLRGLLLNAYAFGKMASIAGIAAVISFVAAAVMLVLSLLGFRHLRHTAEETEVLPNLASHATPITS